MELVMIWYLNSDLTLLFGAFFAEDCFVPLCY